MAKQTIRSGEAIKTLRTLAGLTLDQASQLAQTAPAYLSKVENGRLIPTRGYVANVCRAISTDMQRAHSSELNEKVPS